jgi:fatty acid amide hydrolase
LPPGIDEAAAIYFGAMSSDGGATATSLLQGDPLDPSLARFRRVATLPTAARAAIAAAMRLRGDRRAADLVTWLGERTTTGYWELTRRARAYRLRLLGAMRDAGLDALLCPAHATPALPHGLGSDFVAAGFASMLFNLVQFPAVVVPVTTVQPGEAGRGSTSGRLDANAAAVDARSEGLPLGVQIVATPWRDEEALALAMALDDALAGDPLRPRTPRAVP